MPITEVEKIWMDGELVDWADAKIHVLSHALHYGWASSRGSAPTRPRAGRPCGTWTSISSACIARRRSTTWTCRTRSSELVEATKDVIRANGLRSCYVRPLAFRGYGEMGVNPLARPGRTWSIAVWPWGAYLGEDALEQGVRVKVSSWKRHDQNALPSAAKASGQYIGSILAKVEALKAGYDEAIMLNDAGYIAEGSGENVFVVDARACSSTPPTRRGCLDGITRRSVITIARDLGYEVVERNLVRTDLYLADEVLLHGHRRRDHADPRGRRPHGRRRASRRRDEGAPGRVLHRHEGRGPRYAGWLTYVDD